MLFECDSPRHWPNERGGSHEGERPSQGGRCTPCAWETMGPPVSELRVSSSRTGRLLGRGCNPLGQARLEVLQQLVVAFS